MDEEENKKPHFLIVGDVHYAERPPKRRTLDYGAQIIEKIEWCAEVAKTTKCAGVIFTGDLFHRKQATKREVYTLMHALKKFPCKVWGIVGNHDVVGHNSDDLSGTGIGLLFESEVIIRVQEGLGALHSVVAITGADYCPDYESTDPYDIGSDQSPRIRVTHGTLVQERLPFDIPQTIATEIDVPDHVLLVNGHIHAPYEVGNVWNVGSLCRASIEDQKTNHEPRVLFAAWLKGKWEVRSIVVPIHPNVWTAEDERTETKDRDAIADFVEQLEIEAIVDGRDIETLERLLEDQPEDVRELVHELLAAQEVEA